MERAAWYLGAESSPLASLCFPRIGVFQTCKEELRKPGESLDHPS